MPELKITTAQNVTLNYRLATVLDRLVGGLIDFVAQFIYIMIVMMILVPVLFHSAGGGEWSLLLFLPVVFYSLFFDLFLNGRSIGKLIMGTKVIRTDESRTGFVSYFLRWIMRIVDVYYTLGVLAIGFIFFNKKAQRLGDILARTAVVKVKPPVRYHPMMRYLPKNYQISYPEVEKLRQEDVMAIDELLRYYMRLGISFRVNELIYKTKEKVENLMGRKVQKNAHKFLQVVVTDYIAVQNQKQKVATEELSLTPDFSVN